MMAPNRTLVSRRLGDEGDGRERHGPEHNAVGQRLHRAAESPRGQNRRIVTAMTLQSRHSA